MHESHVPFELDLLGPIIAKYSQFGNMISNFGHFICKRDFFEILPLRQNDWKLEPRKTSSFSLDGKNLISKQVNGGEKREYFKFLQSGNDIM